MHCPYCFSFDIVKNGSNGVGTQKYKCKSCKRQFVENPKNKRVSGDTKRLVDRLLLERIPLAGVARVAGVSEPWLQGYANDLYAGVPRAVTVAPKGDPRLTVECDEAWSFVGHKGNKQWVWLAIDRDTREVVGAHVGERDAKGAQALWDSMPFEYRRHAHCHSDFWEAYRCAFPEGRHSASGKDAGQTNHVERFNCTLRQRVSRLVRKTLSFSKKLENHIGAIWYFIHHYNSQIRQRLACA